MAIKRIVADLATQDVAGLRRFYSDLFDMRTAMDHGWIVTLATGITAPVQISIASEGGSGTPVPHLSIEVDDIEATYQRAKTLGHPIPYDLTDEPWGVRRFFVQDPAGHVLNVLAHKT